VSARRADLLFDQVVVVEKPLARRRDPAIGGDRIHQQQAGRGEDILVLGQAGQESIRGVIRAERVPARQGAAVLLHLLAAEQLRPQRRLGDGAFLRQAGLAEACKHARQASEQGSRVDLHR
jgi:hypothetical protein